MEILVHNLIENVQVIIQNNNYIFNILIGMFIIILESMIPLLPLALFIALNMLMFGTVLGFLLSWVATVIGCSISFFIFRFLHKKRFNISVKHLEWLNHINQISFSTLVILLSIPFTPAFSINIAAGLSNMSYSKYLFALLISKLFLVYFWGFIGTTLIESLTDIGVLWKLGTMIFLAFLLSKFVNRYFCVQ